MAVKILMIGLGGFTGSVLRYVLSGLVQQGLGGIYFPYGTLAINLMGCLLIGFLSHLSETYGLFAEEARSLVFIGLLGGFTTFSTFANETWNLLRDGENGLGLANAGVHLLGGLLAVWVGRAVAHVLWR